MNITFFQLMKRKAVRSSGSSRTLVILLLMLCMVGFHTMFLVNQSDDHKIPVSAGIPDDVTEAGRLKGVHVTPDMTCGNKEGWEVFPSYHLQPFASRAVLTFYTSTPADGFNGYFDSTRMLLHSLLTSEQTRLETPDTEVVVVVNMDVSDDHIKTFVQMGARVIRMHDIIIDGVTTGVSRWAKCYTKLNFFAMRFYQTIVYYDVDMLMVRPIDELFQHPELAADDDKYFFGAVRESPSTFNAGMMVFKTSCRHYYALLELAPQKSLYESGFLEQGLLNYYFRHDSPPSGTKFTEVDPKYNANFLVDKGKVDREHLAMIHDKFWYPPHGWRSKDVVMMWWEARERILNLKPEQYYIEPYLKLQEQTK